ncbi:hypothetical protein ACFPYJ_20075 [Paenibacillus solisilvae]|uniref:Uncharacterized protein n=1 Tax=Paenibacillus solisilvae TaxID=2486751 RepID=A0ABW0VZR1_9BACL
MKARPRLLCAVRRRGENQASIRAVGGRVKRLRRGAKQACQAAEKRPQAAYFLLHHGLLYDLQ